MGEPRSPASRNSTPNCSPNSSPSCSSSTTPPPPPLLPTVTTLVRPTSQKKKHKTKVFRVFRSVFRSFPILTTTTCKFPHSPRQSQTVTTTGVSRRHQDHRHFVRLPKGSGFPLIAREPEVFPITDS
ncbi:hypothetical protein L6164_025092 [Bauhinia variegata]|uniref:Uncharacterized protein n=1 Tax=Bauhinia variegata TaxID=167791 RepID=A0ACB9M0V7_BAUVA|nr:hypothetical protein L6164_025092 [Bauhinia variegata]